MIPVYKKKVRRRGTPDRHRWETSKLCYIQNIQFLLRKMILYFKSELNVSHLKYYFIKMLWILGVEISRKTNLETIDILNKINETNLNIMG